MVNWTPTSWVADLGEILGRYRPTSAPLPSPTRWGDRQGIDELLGPHASVQANERTFLFRFRSVAHHVDFLLEHRCDFGQGYFFSAPVDAQKLYPLLKQNVIARP